MKRLKRLLCAINGHQWASRFELVVLGGAFCWVDFVRVCDRCKERGEE